MEAPIKIPKRSFINNKQAISFFSSLVLLLLHFFLTLIQTLEFWNILSSSRFRVLLFHLSSPSISHLKLRFYTTFSTLIIYSCVLAAMKFCVLPSHQLQLPMCCVYYLCLFSFFFSFKHFVDSHFLLVLLLAFHFTSPSHRPQPRPASPAKHLVSCDALFHTTAAPATTQNVYTKNEVLIFSDCHDVHWFSLSVYSFISGFIPHSFFFRLLLFTRPIRMYQNSRRRRKNTKKKEISFHRQQVFHCTMSPYPRWIQQSLEEKESEIVCESELSREDEEKKKKHLSMQADMITKCLGLIPHSQQHNMYTSSYACV